MNSEIAIVLLKSILVLFIVTNSHVLPCTSGVPRGGFGVFNSPPSEILKALQNRAKLNLIVKTVKNC